MANPDANRARPGAGGSRAPTAHVTAVDASTGTLTARAFAAANPPRFRAARTAAAGDTSVAVRTTAPFPASAATNGCSDWLCQRQDQCRFNNRHTAIPGARRVATGREV